jgi:uncharacterized protein (TIGR03437 family)
VGKNSLSGVYSGDSHYAPGSSQPLFETVLGSFTPTATTIGSSVNPSSSGNNVTFTANLIYTFANSTYPTGTVTFKDARTGAVLGIGQVQTSGSARQVFTAASITAPPLAAGSYAVQASYSGDNIYGGSVSPVMNQVVIAGGAGSAPAIVTVINGGSYLPGIQAGSWVTIKGVNLANIADPGRIWRSDEVVNGKLPTSLDGVSVTINNKPASVYFISQKQIDVLAPDDTALGLVDVVVTNNGMVSSTAAAELQPYAPAFFQWGATNYATATRYPDNAYIGNPSAVPGTVAAKPGDVLILWANGFGPTQPATPAGLVVTTAAPTTTMPTVMVGGADVKVLSAVISPGSAGLYQIAIQLPQTIALGDQTVVASVGGFESAPHADLFIANQ